MLGLLPMGEEPLDRLKAVTVAIEGLLFAVLLGDNYIAHTKGMPFEIGRALYIKFAENLVQAVALL